MSTPPTAGLASPSHSPSPAAYCLTGPELTAAQLHDVLQLRSEIFVVEQECAYQEVDGADLLASTTHRWQEDADGIVCYLRVLDHGEERQIGRVVTRVDRRGAGLAAALVAQAAADHEPPIVLEAQSHLVTFYEQLGFAATGPEFLEDGIPHVPMKLNQ